MVEVFKDARKKAYLNAEGADKPLKSPIPHATLKAARAYRPQLVFLDIGLPGLNGYEVARRLRDEFGPDVRLVAMTGYGHEEDRRRAQAEVRDKAFSAVSANTRRSRPRPPSSRHPGPSRRVRRAASRRTRDPRSSPSLS